MLNKNELIENLEKGREKWIKFINNMGDQDLLNFYCNLYNNVTGNNYASDYILGDTSIEDIESSLLNYNYNDEQVDRFLRAVDEYNNYKEGGGNYSFSYITNLGYMTYQELMDVPTLDWFSTIEGFQWLCSHC